MVLSGSSDNCRVGEKMKMKLLLKERWPSLVVVRCHHFEISLSVLSVPEVCSVCAARQARGGVSRREALGAAGSCARRR